MNRNHFRTAVIGVTAGVTAGLITVAGIIAYDDYGPLSKAREALNRRRLLSADRAELDRLRAARTTHYAGLRTARDERTTLTRMLFRPGLLLPHNMVALLEDLSVPALLTEIERAVFQCGRLEGASNWPGHRDALINEFNRRRNWAIEYTLPELDRLRLEAAADRVQGMAADAVLRRPVFASRPAGTESVFEGPDEVGHAAMGEE
ncbi:hypothetical protein ACFXHA_38880 [Nocardia sp. NPDC059240]|uniref:hypothetical protein n=1 Tax=Nocardia sp. NPDC059240 TaxID=3346786 RepID=UPI0036978D78